MSKSTAKPPIIVGEADHERLLTLANSALVRFPDVAEELQTEMERERVVPAKSVPANVVQMGSLVEFRFESGKRERVKLVFPSEADMALGKISVLTPIGAALIGLSTGQSIGWRSPDGRSRELTVTAVEQSTMATPDATASRSVVAFTTRPSTSAPAASEPSDPNDDNPGPRAA